TKCVRHIHVEAF
ncbi:hypothetical protein VCHENC02_2878B, partial [Vibrio harveyi]